MMTVRLLCCHSWRSGVAHDLDSKLASFTLTSTWHREGTRIKTPHAAYHPSRVERGHDPGRAGVDHVGARFLITPRDTARFRRVELQTKTRNHDKRWSMATADSNHRRLLCDLALFTSFLKRSMPSSNRRFFPCCNLKNLPTAAILT